MSKINKEKIVETFFMVNGVSAILILVGIFIFLGATGLKAFFEISFTEFFFGDYWNPEAFGAPSWGILPLVMGTLYVTIVALIISIPLGVATAVYLAEIASITIREILKPVIEIIAGLPSVILGLFGLLVLAPFFSSLFGIPYALNALTAGILVGFMALPTVASISEDVLVAIPQEYRDASLALGASKWQTIKMVIVPAASSGIAASIMLGLGRIVGETMVVLMVAGNSKALPHSFLDPVRPMTANIAIEIKEVVQGGLHYEALFAIGLLLFLITFLVNFFADILVQRYGEVY